MDIIEQANIDNADFQDIQKISPKEEAKMANGYFAYHVDVLYKDGLRIEIQIFSKMSEIWRHLSHKLYEKVRLGEDVKWGHGTAASRLVSLGHLLHLAECEVEFLKSSMQR
jgi:ppGpp synthetase/RelA/SpoT-type nucleotidyltranferase